MGKYNIQKHLELIEQFRKNPKPWWTQYEVTFPAEGTPMKAIINGIEYKSFCPPQDQLPCIIGFGSPDKIILALSCFMYCGKPSMADHHYTEGGKVWQPCDLGEIEICPISGVIIDYHLTDCIEREIINQAKVGFGVAFFTDVIVRREGHPYWFIIDGHSYSCPESGIVKEGHHPRSTNSLRGYGGRTFKIQKGDQLYVTDDLWHGGAIPIWMRDRYPDNAAFV